MGRDTPLEDGERDDQGKGGVGGVGAGVDVRVAGLVELQHAEAGDHVHEGGVWAEEPRQSGSRRRQTDL